MVHTICGSKAAFVYPSSFIAVHLNFTFYGILTVHLAVPAPVCCLCCARVGCLTVHPEVLLGQVSANPASPIWNKRLMENWLDGWLVNAWMDERMMTARMDGWKMDEVTH